ncbi:hypothetical protein BH23GEM5_BH23GEM5_30040 [soil metagenome]
MGVEYYNKDVNVQAYRPVETAWVQIWYSYFDKAGNYVSVSSDQYTRRGGSYAVDCSIVDQSFDGLVEYKADIRLRNSDVQVGGDLGWWVGVYEPDLRNTCYGSPRCRRCR